MAITYTEVESNLRELASNINKDTLPFDLLAALGTPKANITRLKNKTTDLNTIKVTGQMLYMFRNGDLSAELASVDTKPLGKNKIRFVVVTNGDDIHALDIKNNESIITKADEIHLDFEFFLPMAGIEKFTLATESEADGKAALKMAKLFDTLKVNNTVENEEQGKAMNVFLSRVLFCLFAEDTGIFPKKDQFTNYIGSITAKDGSDVDKALESLFDRLDSATSNGYSAALAAFPYVNGGLFAEKLEIPKFNTRARNTLIECGSLDWSEINPDIFGSMIQAVVDTSYRGNMGMHYTSVPNIMKVLKPLFLDELHEEFAKILTSEVKNVTKVANLEKLVRRIGAIKIGDMACGSGNFLIIAYKELRKLEMSILVQVKELSGEADQMVLMMGAPISAMSLGQFYGIEYDEFAAHIAELSMWLAEHQMNMAFKDRFGECAPTLPLKTFNHIIHGNSLRIDWAELMPNDGECYIVGNPPFLGSSMQNKEQKEDMAFVFKGFKKYKNLDYVSAWFLKGKNYLKNSHAKCAFVSTNSICQGDSVGLLWEEILSSGVEIGFAHTEFKWNNNAKSNAAVMCVIVGIRNKSTYPKQIIADEVATYAKNINAYLSDGDSVIVNSSKERINELPEMVIGSKPTDGGFLNLSQEEKDELIAAATESNEFIQKYVGSSELIKNEQRFCLWITDEARTRAEKIPAIKARLEQVAKMRANSKAPTTRPWAEKPHKFLQFASYQSKHSIIVSGVSSESREYVPMSFASAGDVASNAVFSIYEPEDYVFAVLSNKMHMAWVKAVGGRLKSDIRYSNTLCYNTYPVPELSGANKDELKRLARAIIGERIMCGGSLAELYDPKNMPESLRAIHDELDTYIDELYRKEAGRTEPIKNDNDRLEVLFKLYAEKVAK